MSITMTPTGQELLPGGRGYDYNCLEKLPGKGSYDKQDMDWGKPELAADRIVVKVICNVQ